MNQFQILANITSKLFTKDELPLDFKGYNDFLEKFEYQSSFDAEGLSEIIKESILWNDYISEVINSCNILLFSLIADMEAMKANYISKDIQAKTREKLTMLKTFKREMYIQKQHCINIYYKTMKTYEKSMQAFSINDYVNV